MNKYKEPKKENETIRPYYINYLYNTNNYLTQTIRFAPTMEPMR